MLTRIFFLAFMIITFKAIDILMLKNYGEISKIKQNLEFYGFVVIPGKDMKSLLIQHGASREDMAVLESGYIHQHLPIDQQPVMHHRLVSVTHHSWVMVHLISQNSCHRVLLNMTDNTIFTADTHAITQYPSKEIASEKEDGAKIAYRR